MDLIATLLKEQAPQLVSAVTSGSSLSEEEAGRFVPEATQATVDALQQTGSGDLGQLLEGGNWSSLLGKLDVLALAERAGIGESKVTEALQTFVPQLLQLLNSKGGGSEGVLSLLGQQKAGGVLGLARKFLKR
jgi:hypothetical protein